MRLHSLKPFIPSGADFEQSKQFFLDLGFQKNWESDGYAEFALGGCAFILQDFDHAEMQSNLMMHVSVDDLDEWWKHVQASGVVERYASVRAKEPTEFPWGIREVHLIDPAGVCWHFASA